MTSKKLILGAVCALFSAVSVNAGAPPTVMFLPDKTWCNNHDYVTRSERNGKVRVTENYDAAFMDSDLSNVKTQLNALLKDNGLVPKDYGATTELDDEEEMEEEAYNGDTPSGGENAATDYEMLLSKLRPDIIIKVGWDVNKVGFNYTCSYRLEALDSYSGKSIAAITAETPTLKTTIPLAAAIKNAATEHMPQFISRLQEHFDDLQANGREITVTCRISSASDANFNTDFDGRELSTVISDWMNDNTVNHSYSMRNSSRNRLVFEQVRIPFTDANGRVMQAKEFVDQLKRYLKSTCGISSENATKGLGSGRLYDMTH
ncbi:MAG: hypothetical protein K2L05_05340 [Muribaculaceae bacterium]|nr:hypothetical protein [Muribaculaceae bacterium]